MKILIGIFIFVLVSTLLLFGIKINTLANASKKHSSTSYIQLSSSDTQIVTDTTANTPLKATLNSQDGIVGTALSWSKDDPSTIIINEDGNYFIIAFAQIGAIEYTPYAGGNITIWYTQNGKTITNSAVSCFAAQISRSKNLTSQIVINGKKGDKIGLMYSAAATNGGLLAYPADAANNIPNAPSLTVTMYKLK